VAGGPAQIRGQLLVAGVGVGQGFVLFQEQLKGILLWGREVTVGKRFERVEVLARCGGRIAQVEQLAQAAVFLAAGHGGVGVAHFAPQLHHIVAIEIEIGQYLLAIGPELAELGQQELASAGLGGW